jgi:transcriptional regulator with XRE-family HTH domain
VTDFGDALDRLIRCSGADAQDIARQVPCNPGHISRLRRGKKRPSFQVARRLDEVLGAGGELVAAAARDILPAELAALATPAAGKGSQATIRQPALEAAGQLGETEDLVAALRALVARVEALTEALSAGNYPVPDASGRRPHLYLVRPPDEAG